MLGQVADYAQVVLRGDVAGRQFSAFWLDESHRVLAGMNVNIWEGLDDIKALIRGKSAVDPARLADAGVLLAELTG
ncbi:MAG TPA: oxidoreductase C-terminal domain-containing protein, partial [Mycobacterium sp.]|nr:oxidoreductase C-terminal domain-containing protein [Mycobacterium sp.]